jgi:hypothetical protein
MPTLSLSRGFKDDSLVGVAKMSSRDFKDDFLGNSPLKFPSSQSEECVNREHVVTSQDGFVDETMT